VRVRERERVCVGERVREERERVKERVRQRKRECLGAWYDS